MCWEVREREKGREKEVKKARMRVGKRKRKMEGRTRVFELGYSNLEEFLFHSHTAKFLPSEIGIPHTL